MYETMSDIDTGTNGTTSLYWKKSDASSSAARNWYLVGSDRLFYFLPNWASSINYGSAGFAFGEILTKKSGDAYNSIIIGHTSSAPSAMYSSISFPNTGSAQTSGQYIARTAAQTGTAVGFYKQTLMGGSWGYSSGITYPNGADNGLHLVPVEVIESNTLRGRLPGIYCPIEAVGSTLPTGDRTVVIDGVTYLAVQVNVSSSQVGACFFNLSSWN